MTIESEILNYLGVRDKNVVAATLRLRAGRPPTLTVQTLLLPIREGITSGKAATETHRFKIVPSDER